MRYFHAGENIEFVLTENQERTYEKHNHVTKYVAGLILNGCAEIFDGIQTFSAMQDDLFIIPVYRVHALRLNAASTRILTMCIGVDFLEQNNIEEGMRKLKLLIKELRENRLIGEKQETAYLDAYEIICRMHEEQERLPEQIEAITQKVVEAPEQDWRLDELADSIYINKYYMVRKFKETVGLTPHYFQIQNRVRKAQHLLQKGISVADTAAEMGFYDQSHFDKAFHSILGISPKEYVESLE